jgi:hypothetical protein
MKETLMENNQMFDSDAFILLLSAFILSSGVSK